MVGTQYQAEVPSCLSHYKDGENGSFPMRLKCLSTSASHITNCPLLNRLTLPYVSCYPVYEDEDELLWSPGVIPESKVRSFLFDVLSRTTDEKPGYDKPGIHVRDNEQVCNVFQPAFVLSCIIIPSSNFILLFFLVFHFSHLCITGLTGILLINDIISFHIGFE